MGKHPRIRIGVSLSLILLESGLSVAQSSPRSGQEISHAENAVSVCRLSDEAILAESLNCGSILRLTAGGPRSLALYTRCPAAKFRATVYFSGPYPSSMLSCGLLSSGASCGCPKQRKRLASKPLGTHCLPSTLY